MVKKVDHWDSLKKLAATIPHITHARKAIADISIGAVRRWDGPDRPAREPTYEDYAEYARGTRWYKRGIQLGGDSLRGKPRTYVRPSYGPEPGNGRDYLPRDYPKRKGSGRK